MYLRKTPEEIQQDLDKEGTLKSMKVLHMMVNVLRFVKRNKDGKLP